MPCNSDYMEPTKAEQQIRKTSQLLSFALTEMGIPVPDWVTTSADHIYGRGGENSVKELCSLISSMSPEDKERVIYDAHSKDSRDLANWWELHQEADRKRQEKKTAKQQQEAVKKKALEKLTPEEREALGL